MQVVSKYYCVILILGCLLTACSSPDSAEYKMDEAIVYGEFLFEGPNTLQGKPAFNLADMADELDINPDEISAVYVREAEIAFNPILEQSNVESALLQLVSDELEMVAVASKSPLPEGESVMLDPNLEQNILPYLKDSSLVFVVDVNINQNMDELQAKLNLKLDIIY